MRDRLGYASKFYRFASRLLGWSITLWREGPFVLLKLEELKQNSAKTSLPIPLKLRALKHPINIRPGTNDINVMINNIIRREYGKISLPARPCLLIDAGAYIGDTSAYFLSCFPNLTCIALEPNPVSYALAEKNLRAYGDRVTLKQVALASTDGDVFLSGEETGAHIDQTGGIKVPAITISKILEEVSDCYFKILKLDIEGAEVKLFESHPETWLTHIDQILVETHSAHGTEIVLSALHQNGWTTRRYRNLYYCQPQQQDQNKLDTKVS
ncbi:FkbM family methyltransferase [bacterium AH-315-P15]|nr:FkbM family methyltransferase [bacterium AH-315-P15]